MRSHAMLPHTFFALCSIALIPTISRPLNLLPIRANNPDRKVNAPAPPHSS